MFAQITRKPSQCNGNAWIPDLTNEQHHNLLCISSSHLKYLANGQSMANYYRKFVLRQDYFRRSKAFEIGTLAHMAVLEPEKFEKSVLVSDLDQRTKSFKDFKMSMAKVDDENKIQLEQKIKELEEELLIADTKEQTKVIKEKIKKTKKELQDLPDDFKIETTKDGGFIDKEGNEKFIATEQEMKMYKAFQKKFEDHPRLGIWLQDCVIEESGVAQDPETELWMSLKGDARCDRGFFIDPKTIDSELSVDAIQKYISDYHLHIQAAHYLETANLISDIKYEHFFFVFMSKQEPYDIALIKLDQSSIEKGKVERRKYLNKIRECELENKWPSFDFNEGKYAITLGLPAWRLACQI